MFSDPQHNIEQFNLQPGLHVADIGAGSGYYTLAAARAVGPEGRVYAVEIQQDLLTRVMNEAKKQNLTNIEGIWGDVETLGGTKIADNSLNAALAANILFQVENKAVFSAEIARILKKDGGLLVVDWAGSFSGMGPAPEHVVMKDAAREIFKAAGFVEAREIEAGAQHWGIIFKKQ